MANDSVVKLVPDAVRGEFINIGIIGFDDEKAQCKFIQNWTRPIVTFGEDAVKIAQEFAADIEERCDPATESQLTFEEFQYMIDNWHAKIQFTPLRSSLRDLNHLIQEMQVVFLIETVFNPSIIET